MPSQLNFLIRSSFSLFLLFFSQLSYSLDYYWSGRGPSGVVIDDQTPTAVCQRLFALVIRPGTNPISVTQNHATSFNCRYYYIDSWQPAGIPGNPVDVQILRFGDSCPEGNSYSETEFKCVPPSPPPADCSASAGTTSYHLSATGKTRTSPDAPWPSGTVTGSPTMCSGSCQFSLAQSIQVQCGSLKGGDPLIQYCLFKYSGTGQPCSAGDPAQNSGSTAPVPPTDPNDPTDPANNCGPTHVWSGSVCVPKLDPDPADPTDPGTGGTDPGTGGGGPGTGGGDPGTGGGDPGTGGGDPGTGGGDPGDDGPDEEGDVVKGEACDLDLTCEGDALQCAMLRQQKADRCNWQLDSKQTKQIVDSFTGDKYKLGESSTDIGSSFSTALNSPRFLPASCPPPQRINIQGRSYSLPWSYVCDFASGLSYLIVAMAGVFFVTYVGRGFGGD